jgi:Helix-turn-helix domain
VDAKGPRGLGMTADIATAGFILGIGRGKAYELAKSGEFPITVLRIGRRYLVPTSALLALLGASGCSATSIGQLVADRLATRSKYRRDAVMAIRACSRPPT